MGVGKGILKISVAIQSPMNFLLLYFLVTQFCSPLIYNQNLLQIMKIENEYNVLLQNTCCARPGDRRQGGYTEYNNRLYVNVARPCQVMKTGHKVKLNQNRTQMNL